MSDEQSASEPQQGRRGIGAQLDAIDQKLATIIDLLSRHWSLGEWMGEIADLKRRLAYLEGSFEYHTVHPPRPKRD